MADLTKEQEEEDGVKVAEADPMGGGGGARVGVEEGGEEVEEGEDVAGNEEGFLGERKGVEVIKGVGEEGRGGDKGDEAAAVLEEGGGERVTEGGELRGGEGGEGSHEGGFCSSSLVSHGYDDGIMC